MSSPKVRFQESKENLSFWAELVTKAAFLRGLDAALLQMHSELSDSDDPATASARFQRMNGAKKFSSILMNLPEIVKERTPLPDMNLRPIK